MFPVAVYSLCAATALLCSYLLLRNYLRTRVRLLLWSGLCFALFCLGNTLLFIDIVMVPDINLYPLRAGAMLVGLLLLLFGLIWEAQ